MAESQQTPPSGKAGAAARIAAQRAAKAARKAAHRAPVDPLVADDEIAESVEAASSWLDHNQRLLWGGFAALLIGGALVLGITSTREKAAREAADSLVAAEKTAIAPVIPDIEASQPDDAKLDQETFPTAKARAEEALSDFRATVDGFGETAAGRWAKLGEANALLELGKFEEALTAFKSVEAQGAGEAFLRYRATEGQGFALEGQQKFREALTVFEESAKVADGLYKTQAELNAARMLQADGKRDEAVARLKALVTAARERAPEAGLDDSYYVELAEERLAQLGSPVAKGAGGMSADIMEQIRRQLGGNVKIENPAQGTSGE